MPIVASTIDDAVVSLQYVTLRQRRSAHTGLAGINAAWQTSFASPSTVNHNGVVSCPCAAVDCAVVTRRVGTVTQLATSSCLSPACAHQTWMEPTPWPGKGVAQAVIAHQLLHCNRAILLGLFSWLVLLSTNLKFQMCLSPCSWRS